MKKAVLLCLAALLASGCYKEKIVTVPCGFDVKMDWVKGTRVQFTITPDNPDATYVWGNMIAGDEYADWTDAQLMDWQLGWMLDTYDGRIAEGLEVTRFSEMFCYKGARTFRDVRLSPGKEWWLLVFQINPQTREAIGPLYRIPFKTREVPMAELSFTIHDQGDGFTIYPSDPGRTWFWEYERDARIEDVYEDDYTFFYDIIGMYDEYDFLGNMLCRGEQKWVLCEDPSIREGEAYTLVMSGCAEGEITSEVCTAGFVVRRGRITFTDHDASVSIQ